MSNNFRLFTLPPNTARTFDHHRQSHDTVHAKVIRTYGLRADTIVADNLEFRDGTDVVNPDFLLLHETASQTPPPNAGQGRMWLRGDAPNRLIFTNDTGTDIALTPGLDESLAIESDAANQALLNVTGITFNGGIAIGNETAAATTNGGTQIAIGQGAATSASNSLAIGTSSSASNAASVAIGTSSTSTVTAPNSNDSGGVSIGNSVVSHGPGICIGHTITNTSPQQDGTSANIFIGNSITSLKAQVSSIDTSGVFAQLVTTAAASKYFTLWSANNATGYYVWFANGTSLDPAPSGLTAIQINFTPLDGAVTSDATLATTIGTVIHALGDFNATTLLTVVTVTNAATGSATAIANVNVTNLTVATLQQGIVPGNAIAIGSKVKPSANSIVIGREAGTNIGGSENVNIGISSRAYGTGSVCIGLISLATYDEDVHGPGYSVAIGGRAESDEILCTSIGNHAYAQFRAGVALGRYAYCLSANSVAIGGGNTQPYAAYTSASNAVAIGENTSCDHANSVCIGTGVESRVQQEWAGRGFRFVRATVSTANATTTTLVDIPTVSGDVIHVDGSVTAFRSTADTTYTASLEDFHFRNKAGTLTKVAGIGSVTEDTTEASYTTAIDVSGTNIRISVTGTAGHNVTWTCLLKLYASALV